jgi:hypothetical protein
MKQIKFFFLLSALFCVFSCGDNDANYDARHYYIEGRYPNLEIGSDLILVYNGDTLTNKTVDFTTRGLKNGILTFENVIPGETKTVLTVDLVESENPDNGITKLLFDGVYFTKSRPIQYSGFVDGLLLLLELKEE